MTKPVRIQRQRSKGWKLPPNTVVVTRPTKWGNPFIVTDKIAPGRHVAGPQYYAVSSIEEAVECFRETMKYPGWRHEDIGELRGKNLACWCALDQPCHADVLLEIANAPMKGE